MKKMLKNAVSCTLAGIMAISSLCFSAFGQKVSETDASEAVGAVSEAVPAEGMAEYEDKKADTYTSEYYEYSILEDGTAEILGYTGGGSDLVVPSEINGIKVTAIGEYAFQNGAYLSISIPSSVTVIGKCAFDGCNNITSLDLKNGLKSIGAYAFSNCGRLIKATLPDSVEGIGRGAFAKCINLESINYPLNWSKNISYINTGGSVFDDCKKLTKITIPEGVTTIHAEGVKNIT